MQTRVARFCRIAGRLGVAEDQSRRPFAKAAPEFENCVAADRDSNEWSAIDTGCVHQASHIRGVLLHGRRTVSQRRLSVATQVRHDQAKSLGKKLADRKPEFVIGRKRVEQNYRRTAAGDVVEDFSIIADDLFHLQIIGAKL